MRKRILISLIAILLFCTTGVTALAHDVPNLNQSGSITVKLQDNEKKLSSGTLTFYRVGEIRSTDGDYHFVPTEAFASSEKSLETVHFPEFARDLLEYAQKNNISGKTLPIQDGTVRYEIESGQLGLYLVVQHQAAVGYNPIAPFLVSVPISEDNQYVYDVNATPKVEIITKTNASADSTAKPAGTVLPQTGQLKYPVPVFAIVGLCLIGSGMILRNAPRDENEK